MIVRLIRLNIGKFCWGHPRSVNVTCDQNITVTTFTQNTVLCSTDSIFSLEKCCKNLWQNIYTSVNVPPVYSVLICLGQNQFCLNDILYYLDLWPKIENKLEPKFQFHGFHHYTDIFKLIQFMTSPCFKNDSKYKSFIHRWLIKLKKSQIRICFKVKKENILNFDEGGKFLLFFFTWL